MTTKQILLSIFILGATASNTLAMNQEAKIKQQEMNKELLDAAHIGKLKKATRLLNAGANVNAKNEYHKGTALHNAAAMLLTNMFKVKDENRIAIAEMLIKNGADINAQNKYGYTPAHCAAYRCDRSMLELLAKNGADFNLENKDGDTPFMTITKEKSFWDNNNWKNDNCQDAYNFLLNIETIIRNRNSERFANLIGSLNHEQQ
jgi:ankyrin repeat protein